MTDDAKPNSSKPDSSNPEDAKPDHWTPDDWTPTETQAANRSSVPGPFSYLGEELREDVPIQNSMFAKAIGGWRGIVDTSLPSLVFIVTYLVTSQNLTTAIWAAIGIGALVAVWRLLRRQSIQQVLGGFAGVAISAFVASRTGNAADFFLPGLLTQAAYGIGLAVSNIVRWPVIGLAVGGATGDLTGWRKDKELVKAYRLATWVWSGMFFARLAVQLPMYFAGMVGALGITKIVMGWPLMLLVGIWTYRLIKPALAESHARAKAAKRSETSGQVGGSVTETDH